MILWLSEEKGMAKHIPFLTNVKHTYYIIIYFTLPSEVWVGIGICIFMLYVYDLLYMIKVSNEIINFICIMFLCFKAYSASIWTP